MRYKALIIKMLLEMKNEDCIFKAYHYLLAKYRREKGGTDDLDNLQCTCKMCNRLKDNMLPHEFTKFVRCILESSTRIEMKVESGDMVR